MRKLTFLVAVCLLPVAGWAQESDDDEYQTEFLYGINFNTNAGLIGGLVFRYSVVMNPKMRQTFGLEIVNVKNPKELRISSGANGNSYVSGKSNYLFSVRPQYGREILLFQKAPDEGVRISAVGAVGPSIGVIKPYFIAYQYGNGDIRVEQYDPAIHGGSAGGQNSGIVGSSGWTRFDGTQLAVGIHAKVGLGFELGGFRSSATGFEVGYLTEAFSRKIVIMPLTQNRSVFHSVYLNIYFKNKR